MKRLACIAATLLALASWQVIAEQPQGFTYHQPEHGGMIMPSVNTYSTGDLNHRAAGADKSDELGVPYYNQDNAG